MHSLLKNEYELKMFDKIKTQKILIIFIKIFSLSHAIKLLSYMYATRYKDYEEE